MGKENFSYQLIIEFEEKLKSHSGKIEYHKKGEKIYEDTFVINDRLVTIDFKRSKKQELEKILKNSKEEIYLDVLKILLFIILTDKISPIKEIVVKNEGEENKIGEENIYLLNNLRTINAEFEVKNIENIFKKDKKASTLLNACSYYINGLEKKETIDGFVKLWQSFNSLYSYISSKTTEKDKLIEMRRFIIKNKEDFKESINLAKSYELNQFNWKYLIDNDFSGINRETEIVNFLDRNKDIRLNKILKEIFSEDILKNKTDENIGESLEKDEEILCVLILKYCYCRRNKYIHAEINEHIFYLKEDEDIKEIELLNSLFIKFLKELIIKINIENI